MLEGRRGINIEDIDQQEYAGCVVILIVIGWLMILIC